MDKREFWAVVQDRAAELESDGCTGVSDIFGECCLLHDIYYRTHMDIEGNPISRKQADYEFRQCIQERSRVGILSPVAWIRWMAVRLFGHFAWQQYKEPLVK